MAKLDLYYLHLTIKKKEVVSRKRPFEGLGDFQIMREILQGNVPSFIPPSKDSMDMVKVSLEGICRRCWTNDPKGRPTMRDIVSNLRPANSLDQDVLAHIQHLDLSNSIIDTFRKAIAYGGDSEVFRGCLRRDESEPLDVAIKRLRFHVDEEKVKKARPSLNALKRTSGLTNVVQQFARELYVWSKLSHPNVLPLLGFAICEETRFPSLISEWMHFGTAWKYVRENRDLALSDVKELVCSINWLVTLLSY